MGRLSSGGGSAAVRRPLHGRGAYTLVQYRYALQPRANPNHPDALSRTGLAHGASRASGCHSSAEVKDSSNEAISLASVTIPMKKLLTA
jgi:hypothetical protein